MLDRLRTRLSGYFDALGRLFSTVGVSPTAWTFVGLVFSILAGVAYSRITYGGQFLGGVLILVAGFFDLVDGAVARATSMVSRRGTFLDSTLDRLAEVGIFLGILIGMYSTPLIVVLALSSSLLVSYARAKGDALGVALSGVGIGERSERLLVLAISSLLGVLYWGVVLVAIIAWFTFFERTVRATNSL